MGPGSARCALGRDDTKMMENKSSLAMLAVATVQKRFRRGQNRMVVGGVILQKRTMMVTEYRTEAGQRQREEIAGSATGVHFSTSNNRLKIYNYFGQDRILSQSCVHSVALACSRSSSVKPRAESKNSAFTGA